MLDRLSRIIDRLNDRVGWTVSWLTTLLVLLVCFDVITRYLFRTTQAWIVELEWHLFALIFLFGAGYAFRHDRHVRVDLFYAKFSPKDKALVNLVGAVVFLIPWCLLIIYFSFDFAMVSFHDREVSPDPGGLPAFYVIKFAIPAGIFLLLLQAISSLIDALLIYSGYRQPPEESSDLPESI